MLGIRQKLSLGFGGLMAVILIIGIESVSLFSELGGSIDVILKENYRSVIASQDMKEAMERIDSGILFTLLGYEREGADLIDKNKGIFQKALDVELQNITIPGEQEKASEIEQLFRKYNETLSLIRSGQGTPEEAKAKYFDGLLPLFRQIKATADNILEMNQQNMVHANDYARNKARSARRSMTFLLLVGAVLAIAFMILTGRWIIKPIAGLTKSALEIKGGNLDLVVPSRSGDEIGALADAFNDMASGLREFRRSDKAQMIQMRRWMEQTLKALPEAIAIVNSEGLVEFSNEFALKAFDIRPNEKIHSLPLHGIVDLYNEAVVVAQIAEPQSSRSLIQKFIGGKERYFRPIAVPLLDSYGKATGVIMIISDTTIEKEQNEMKRGVVSTVSHQLKTPLTSIRMSLHLLLEEKVGTLTEKQAELLVAAREESERLYSILEKLLNISRIESGKTGMDIKSVRPHELVLESIEAFRSAAADRGLTLVAHAPDDLPDVLADPIMVSQVFANLLSNAIKYTDPGGLVSVEATSSEDYVQFSVRDTGRGIPVQYLKRISEHFFRVPGQTSQSGLGLGLSIVQEIVEAHGGALSVESVESEGSSFTFSLKRSDSSLGEGFQNG